jgi:hypothetical protein
MRLSYYLAACGAVPLATAYQVPPPAGSTAAPETTEDCSGWVVVTSAMTCASICTQYDITVAYFEEMVRS